MINRKWPQVSRRHAEFRLGDGRCFLADTNSKFGTFLNNQRIIDLPEVLAGRRVQFRAGGPVVCITEIDKLSTPKEIPPAVPLHQ